MDHNKVNKNKDGDSAIDLAKKKTRHYGSHLWKILERYNNTEIMGEKRLSQRRPEIPDQYHNRKLLTFLSVIPSLLAGLFLISFYWDFNNWEWQILNYSIPLEGLLKILSVSGLIGFLTNWLAITMLFKPARKRPILGHGLIPAQKNRIAYRIARAVSNDLINPEIIKEKIKESQAISKYRQQTSQYVKNIIDDPSFRQELKNWVVTYVDEMIADREIRSAIAEKIMMNIEEAVDDKSIEKVAIRTYSFIKGQEMQHIIEEALNRLPTSVESGLNSFDDLLDRLPHTLDEHSEVIENMATTLLYELINQLDVHSLVESNLRTYDEQYVSEIIRKATNEQLHYIQYLGAVLGLIGGFIIWQPLFSILFLTTIGGIIVLADKLLLCHAC